MSRAARSHPKHAPRVPFALLVSALVVGGLGLLLILNTASAANELDRHDLASKDASISAELEHLRNAVASSSAPGVLASAAIRLGMVPAGNPAFLVIGADGAVRVLGSPDPASAAPAPVRHPTTAHARHGHTATSTATTSTSATTSASRKPTTGTTPSSRSASSTGSAPTGTPHSTPTQTTSLGGGPR